MQDVEVLDRLYECPADALWSALSRALVDLKGVKVIAVDAQERRITFSTPSSLTSWGEEMAAVVKSAEPLGATLKITGHPRFNFLTTAWGEEMHQHEFVRRLSDSIRKNLASPKQ